MQLFLCKTVVIGFLLLVAIISEGAGADESVPKKGANTGTAAQNNKMPADLTAQLKKKLASIDLPPDVLAKATKIVDEFGPQYVACQVKRHAILTDEQRALHEAKLKSNREAGKQGADVLDGMLDALKFTPKQKKEWDEIQSKKRAIGVAMNAALRGVLNAEQQAKYGLPKKEDGDKEPYGY